MDKLTLGRKGFAGAGGAEVKPIGGFQFFPVRHDDVMGQGVGAVIERLPAHAQLTGDERHEDGRRAGGHAPAYFHLVPAQDQRGHIALLLLPVQPPQGAVVFLCDTAHREHIVFQPLLRGGEVHHGKGEQQHPLIPGLQVGQQVRRVLGKGDKVRGQDVRVIPGTNGLALFLHLHLANVRNLALDGLDGPALVHGLNMQGDGQLRVQLQNLPQELVRHFRRHDLQIAGRAPIPAHPEQAGLGEVKALKGRDGLLGPQAGLCNVPPGKMKGLALGAGVGLAVEHRQPVQPIQRPGLHSQPLEVA